MHEKIAGLHCTGKHDIIPKPIKASIRLIKRFDLLNKIYINSNVVKIKWSLYILVRKTAQSFGQINTYISVRIFASLFSFFYASIFI